MANEAKHPRLPILTKVGRLVSGDPTKKSDIGHQGKKRETASYFFALAVPKTTPGVMDDLGAIFHHTARSYAHVPGISQIIQNNPLPGPYVPEPQRRPFAWKIQDGDWPSNRDKEGWAGCWVYLFSTSGNLNLCDINEHPINPASVHLGMYAVVAGNAVINGLVDANCGLYMNPQYVKIVGDGPLIVTGLTAAQAFAGAPAPQLPPGVVPFVAGGPSGAGVSYTPHGAPPVQYGSQPQTQASPPYNPPVQTAPQQQYAPAPMPPPVQQPQGNAAYAPAAPAYAQPAPPAPGIPAGGYPATAYPSNPPAPVPQQYGQAGVPTPAAYQPANNGGYAQPAPAQPGYPPVQPHHAFAQG